MKKKPDKRQRVLIFVVAYNAEQHLEKTLLRIPLTVWKNSNYITEVLVIDDGSEDKTTALAKRFAKSTKHPITVLKNPVNQGYGGNQKIGYTYAIENNFDVVVLLHGDGQYAPESMPELIEPLIKNLADAVFGSRMKQRGDALKGGMPLYKYIGNKILTSLQNTILGTELSEFHSGYRVYSVAALRRIPFHYNSNDFDFDSDIIIQLHQNKLRIREVPIPTHYGDEVCHVNGVKYGLQILRTTLVSVLQRYGIFYQRKFDYVEWESDQPRSKAGFHSSHSFAITHVPEGSVVLDFGVGHGHVAAELKKKHCRVYGFDSIVTEKAKEVCERIYEVDLDRWDYDLSKLKDFKEKKVDVILFLDTLHHLKNPGRALRHIRKEFSATQPNVLITMSNIGFFLQRVSLLLGQFNYSKYGILGLSHKRLFTFASLAKLLKIEGYDIKKTEGIPVPMPFIWNNSERASFFMQLNEMLIKFSRGLFSYQIAIIAVPTKTLDVLLKDAISYGQTLEDG